MKQLTINELLKLCKQQVKEGNGNRKIIVGIGSSDHEDREYRGITNGFYIPGGHELDVVTSFKNTGAFDTNEIIILE